MKQLILFLILLALLSFSSAKRTRNTVRDDEDDEDSERRTPRNRNYRGKDIFGMPYNIHLISIKFILKIHYLVMRTYNWVWSFQN